MRSIVLAAALLLALAGCGPRNAEPKVTRAWVRLPAVAGNPAAAYFTLAGGRADERLVRVESALAARIELHESMEGMAGMSAMRPIAEQGVPRGTTATFAPGGKHLMLFGVDAAVKPGTAIPLRFGFASGRTAEAEAKTVAAGGDAPY